MPLRVTCTGCEKQLTVGDEAAGKMVRCSVCKTVLTIPNVPAITIKSGGAAGKKAIRISSGRKKEPSLDEEAGLKPLEASQQQSPAPVEPEPEPKRAVAPRSPARKPARRKQVEQFDDDFDDLDELEAFDDDYDDFEEDDYEPAPRRSHARTRATKQKKTSEPKSPLVYVAAGGGGMLALGLIGWLLIGAFTGDDKPTDDSSAESVAASGADDASKVPAERKSGAVAAYQNVKNSVVHLESLASSGTGIILNDQGLILTNAHVVALPIAFRCHVEAEINGRDERIEYRQVQMIGVHPIMDLALVKIDPGEYPKAALKPARIVWEQALAGQQVFAVGNPGAGGASVDLEKSISQGIVSGVDRKLEGVSYIQISAAINPGNSGGPLTNEFGDVLGVVTLKLETVDNVGFAIPLNTLDLADFIPPRKRTVDKSACERLIAAGKRIQGKYYPLQEAGRGDSFSAQLSFAMAMQTYQEAMLSDPSDWRPYLFIGRLLTSIKEFDAAQAYLAHSLSIDPWNYISAYDALGLSLQEAAREKEAITVWREGVARFPFSGLVMWERLAKTHNDRQEWVEAAYCSSAGMYSCFKSRDKKSQAGLMFSILNNARKRASAADRIKINAANHAIGTEIDRMDSESRKHNKLKTPAMRSDFSALATELGINLLGDKAASEMQMQLSNKLLQYPPPRP